MNKGIILSIVFMLFLSLAVSSQAQEEFTSGTLVFPDNALSTPHDPKMDCHPDGDHCLLMFYDSLDQKIKLKYSWNKGSHYQGLTAGCTGFDFLFGCSEIATISNSLDASLSRHQYGSYHLPYDVRWVNEEAKYYLFVENVDYTYIPGGSFATLRTNALTGWGGMFVNDTTYFGIRQAGTLAWVLVDITDNTVEDTGALATGGCVNSAFNIENFRSFAGYNDGSLLYYTIFGYNSQNCTPQETPGGTFPEALGTIKGINYYVDNKIQYNIDWNFTKEATTTDFSSYSGATVINTRGEFEFINNSFSDKIDTNQLFAFERRNVSASATDGIYVYNEQQYPLQIVMNVQDPDRGDVVANTTGTVICVAQNYTQTDTGGESDPIDLTTPCLTGNLIVMQTAEGQPTNFSFSYDVLSGCEGQTTYIYTPGSSGYVGYYDLTIRVRDSIFNTGVSGASLSLSGDSQTTDSSGNAVFEISPIANADFTTETNAGSCLYELSITGNERQYNLLATATGYNAYIENSMVFGDSPFSLESGDFTITKTIVMDQEGSQAEVHVYSSDGIELFPSVVEVEAFGSNHTYIDTFGEFIESNISYSVPALFYLIDGRSSYSANFTLKYFYGDSFDYYQQNVTVFQDGFHTIDFYINENFANLKCTYDTDCPESVCSGSYYKQFSSCSDGLCTYTSEKCDSPDRCDSENGCFDIQYTQSCTLDAECEDACLTNYSMVDKFCGTEGLCLGNTVICSTNCSAIEGICSELLDCLYPEENIFSLVIPRPELDAYENVIRKEVRCNFQNAGDSFCISQDLELLDSVGLLWSTPLLDQVSATPSDWNYKRNDADDGFIFYGISASCSDTCGLSYEYCENGCDVDSGKCKGAITGGQAVYSDWVSQGFAWLNNLIPLQYRLFIWGIFTIIAMALYRSGIKGHQGGDKDTLLIGFVMFLGGVGVGWVHWIFLFMIGFVISFVLWEKFIHK